MALKDFNNYMKKGAVTVMVAAATARSVQANTAEAEIKDKEPERTEQTVEPAPEDTLEKIVLFDEIEVTKVSENGAIVINDGQYIEAEDLDNRKEKIKKYEERQDRKFEEAEPDRIHQDTVDIEDRPRAATYDWETKIIEVPYVTNLDTPNPNISKEARQHAAAQNDQTSMDFKAAMVHEEQHRTNDKLGVYAPGLSGEQYAVIDKYDELSAQMKVLLMYKKEYQDRIEKGESKEEALKVFDGNSDLDFYKNALENGLDPESKESYKLIVEGTIKMWEENYEAGYETQLTDAGTLRSSVLSNDVASIALGNEKEMDKRIEKMIDAIDNTGKLKEHFPKKRLDVSDNVKAGIDKVVKETIGLSKEQREKIDNELGGDKVSDKKKQAKLIKKLSGRDRPKSKKAAKETKLTAEQIKAAAKAKSND
ncbi:MAG: hypothetical protein LBR70_06705 [Lactobacillaceae bacterium]|jgi:hypothetical protein|nr:hypothetical protein [Lactobacillaceae bacterium]